MNTKTHSTLHNNPKCPFHIRDKLQYTWNGILYGCERELTTTICKSTDESHKNNVEQNKPNRKIYIFLES